MAVSLTACGLIALPFHLVSIPLQAIAPKNIYVVNPEGSDPSAQGAILSESVVRVICTRNGEAGTGFIHKSATILTAAHVVSDCDYRDVNVVLPDRIETGVWKFVYNRSLDLAVLFPKASLDGRRVVLLSPLSTLTTGEQVTVWGFPKGVGGVKPILSTGYIAGVETDPVYRDKRGLHQMNTDLWIINGDINPGNSGSPVLRVADGSIIGIVVRRSGHSSGVGYAVPTDAVRNFLHSLEVAP